MKIVVTNDGGDTIATYEILAVNMGDKILEAWHETLDGLELFQCDGCDGWFRPSLTEESEDAQNYCAPCLLRLDETKTLFDGADDERRA